LAKANWNFYLFFLSAKADGNEADGKIVGILLRIRIAIK
jgi:hypothetical protein